MNLQEVMKELEGYGNPKTKHIFLKHGAREPFYNVKVADLKKIVKKVKKNHELSMQLFNTGNSDAMYLAGLIADEKVISQKELDHWADKAYWSMLSECAVAWVAAESPHAWELGMKWKENEKENIACSGWATLSSHITIAPNENLPIKEIETLLNWVGDNLQKSTNRRRYVMNGFVIAVGCYIPELTEKAKKIATKIGKVSVNMGETACKVPDAAPYIQKVEEKGRLGKKRKQARC